MLWQMTLDILPPPSQITEADADAELRTKCISDQRSGIDVGNGINFSTIWPLVVLSLVSSSWSVALGAGVGGSDAVWRVTYTL